MKDARHGAEGDPQNGSGGGAQGNSTQKKVGVGLNGSAVGQSLSPRGDERKCGGDDFRKADDFGGRVMAQKVLFNGELLATILCDWFRSRGLGRPVNSRRKNETA